MFLALAISTAVAAAELVERPVPVVSSAKVPRVLVERIEREFRQHAKRPEGEPITLDLLQLNVDVTAEKDGVIEEDARWRLVPGGGTLDFAAVTGEKSGRFNVRVSVEAVGGEAFTPARVFFVPRGKRRELDGEAFGDGCGKILDVTKAFRARFGPRGFDVYTAAQRYVSTLAGTFVIAGFGQKGLQVGHVTFTDSRWPKLLCE